MYIVLLGSMGHRHSHKHLKWLSALREPRNSCVWNKKSESYKVIYHTYGTVSVKCNSKVVPVYWEGKCWFLCWSRGSMPRIQKGRTLPISSELAPKQTVFWPSVLESVAIACEEDVASFVGVFFFSDCRLQIKIWFTIICCCSK